jgi:hypothetical protein
MCVNKNLSVEGLLVEKERLEGSIGQAVAALAEGFRERTGLDIRSIDVPVLDVSSVIGSQQRFRIGSVSVTTNLF